MAQHRTEPQDDTDFDDGDEHDHTPKSVPERLRQYLKEKLGRGEASGDGKIASEDEIIDDSEFQQRPAVEPQQVVHEAGSTQVIA